ncbi:MAG: hypothetical protein Q7U63_17910 [Polaromonas sp.]|uniref:hypothetical protein n=1 Tax=Polaromonas sp. TaxID=1869339 RepID=UPI0027183169|nr:hypothetical protein [Polaromonas sp.]MDO9115655.1 hypothetical protein [Polaromonas sp.]MDP1887116.1 hypothetical protein [Polaromonas sp.]
MQKSVVLGSVVILIAALLVVFYQTRSLTELKNELEYSNHQLKDAAQENDNLRLKIAILNAANLGIAPTTTETVVFVNRLAVRIRETKPGFEAKFAACINRQIKTQDWGSDGPYSLLDTCINTIENDESAIKLKELDRLAQAAKQKCGTEGNNRFEIARNCWANPNYRLVVAAQNVFFNLLTIPNWLSEQKLDIGSS